MIQTNSKYKVMKYTLKHMVFNKFALLIALISLSGFTLMGNNTKPTSAEAWMPDRVNRIKQVKIDQHVLHVTHIEYDEQFLLSGSGQIYLDFVNTQVEVAFSDAQVDREGNLLAGLVYLQEDAAVQALRDKDGELHLGNEDIAKAYLTLATTNNSLPIGLNNLLSEHHNSTLGKHQLVITDLSISQEGMNINYSMLSPSVNGNYYVFEQKEHLSDNPLELCSLNEMYLTPADPPLQNYEFPLEIKAVSTIDAAKKSKANFNCGGLEDFYLVGEYTFPLDKAKPTDANLTNAMAYFEVTSLEVEQFIADCIVTGYRIPGAEAFYFTPTFARLDYSDSANPNGFPADHPRQVDDTWKGIYLHSDLAFPKGFKKSDGSDLKISVKNFVYDHGDGFSGREKQTDLLDLKTSRLNGWPVSMDLLDLEVKYSSFVKFDIEGELRMPITDTERGFPYALRLNPQGTDLNQQSSIAGLFQLRDKKAFEGTFNIPFLDDSPMMLETSSNIKLIAVNDELQPQADLNGVMAVEAKIKKLPMTFEHLIVNDQTMTTDVPINGVTGGLDKISVATVKYKIDKPSFVQKMVDKVDQSFDFDVPKFSIYTIKVRKPVFYMDFMDNDYSISMNTMMQFSLPIADKGITAEAEFEVVGRLNFDKLNSEQYWEALQFEKIIKGYFWVDVDLGIFRIMGGCRWFDEHVTWGNGLKGAVNIQLKKGMPMQIVGLFQHGHTLSPGSHYYMFFDALVTFDVKEQFFDEDRKKVPSYNIILKKSLHYRTKAQGYKLEGPDLASQSIQTSKGQPVNGKHVKHNGKTYGQNYKSAFKISIYPPYIACYGGGLGFFYNMSRLDPPLDFENNGRFVTPVPFDPNDPMQLLEPGLTLTGAKYIPQFGIVAIKLAAVIGNDPKPRIYNADVAVTFEFNANQIALRSITLDAVFYFLTPLSERADAQAYLSGKAQLNWKNREFYIAANAHVMLHVPDKIAGGISQATLGFLEKPVVTRPLIYGPYGAHHRAGSAGVYFKFNEFNKWYIFIGTAAQPLALDANFFQEPGSDAFLRVRGYMMNGKMELMGRQQTTPRPLSSIHPKLAPFETDYRLWQSNSEINDGRAYLLGASVDIKSFRLNNGVFAFNFPDGIAAGFDIGILSKRCADGSSIGVAGKYGVGRVFMYINIVGEVTLLETFTKKVKKVINSAGKGLASAWNATGGQLTGQKIKWVEVKFKEFVAFPVAGLELAAVAQGRLPNPTYLKAQLKGEAWVLKKGWNKEFDMEWEFERGTSCGNIVSYGSVEPYVPVDNLAINELPIDNELIGYLSKQNMEPPLFINPAKIHLAMEKDVMYSSLEEGQVFTPEDRYIEVIFAQSMHTQHFANTALQGVVEKISLHDKFGNPVYFSPQYIRDKISRPGAIGGFDLVRIHLEDEAYNVGELTLSVQTNWLEETEEGWQKAISPGGGSLSENFQETFEVENIHTELHLSDFEVLVPAWRERYFYTTDQPQLILKDTTKLNFIGNNATVRVQGANNEVIWETLVPVINAEQLVIPCDGFVDKLNKESFYRLQIITEEGGVVFENDFRTSKYSSFAEKLQVTAFAYNGLDVGDDIADTDAAGNYINHYLSPQLNDRFNEVRFKVEVDEGFGFNEVQTHIEAFEANTTSGYFKSLNDFYEQQFGSIGNYGHTDGLYSSFFGRRLSAEELEQWFTFDEGAQFSLVASQKLLNSQLSEEEIKKQKLIEEAAPLWLECEAVKNAQFRFELAASLYNTQNLSSDVSQNASVWNSIIDIQKQYNNCLYGQNCTISTMIPWYDSGNISINVGDNTSKSLQIPAATNEGFVPTE